MARNRPISPEHKWEAIVRRRLDGMTPRSIAASLCCPVGEVKEIIHDWLYSSLPATRAEALALVHGRIEEVVATVAPRARSGNTKAQSMLLKACALQSSIFGLFQPMVSGVNTTNTTTHNTMIVDTRSGMSSTDRLEQALKQLVSSEPAPTAFAASCTSSSIRTAPRRHRSLSR
jgi:hypothetical protein